MASCGTMRLQRIRDDDRISLHLFVLRRSIASSQRTAWKRCRINRSTISYIRTTQSKAVHGSILFSACFRATALDSFWKSQTINQVFHCLCCNTCLNRFWHRYFALTQRRCFGFFAFTRLPQMSFFPPLELPRAIYRRTLFAIYEQHDIDRHWRIASRLCSLRTRRSG